MEHMFNPTTILLHVINAVILLVALYFLLLKPVRKFTSARTARVDAELKQASDAMQDLQTRQTAAEEEIAKAKQKAEDALAQGMEQAQEQAQKILDAAHANAEFTAKQAQVEAEDLRKSARAEMQGEVAELSVLLAEKILQHEVTKADHDKLIDEFFEKVI